MTKLELLGYINHSMLQAQLINNITLIECHSMIIVNARVVIGLKSKEN